MSPTNDPPWLESEDLNDIKSDKIVYVKLSGVWVLFERAGQAPILTFGSGTKPLEYGGAESLKRLYELSKNEKH